jgi:hypothetical protein
MSENIITQVSQDQPVAHTTYEDSDYNSKIQLNVRGSRFTITRDDLMSLPESILLGLFPNGVFLDEEGHVISNLTEEDIVYVNFDPLCFEYIIDVFGAAQRELEVESPHLLPQPTSHGSYAGSESVAQVLLRKPAIIVLREDLDYYVIPPKAGMNADAIRHLKLEVGRQLLENKLVFAGLGYDPEENSDQNLGPAERHLFDMLCTSGFVPLETWGNRSPEPSKCVLHSLLLVRLQTVLPTPPELPLPSLDPVTSNGLRKSRLRIATLAHSAQRAALRSLLRTRKADANESKLLLFWRKPARKCWWANERIPVDGVDVKVHLRRVWTLELSVVGVQ